uniref:ATP synthase complex subunit 8 n=1 Tax=Anoplotrupes stercorosus TaxID=260542 RepID=A0A0S2MRR9_ANOSE|nr:ATP synthase F0 subunit 8 [Anoplotrupes stercorosus]QEL51303.1 ATP synthase F0 subunit 8 [Anoplotrupes stercorosus]QNV12068.1 ATP synthase F0 subunit 8 [Anoplotrupes stercorosus]
MPQMAPLNWLSLLIMFMITFMMFNMLNYFLYLPIPKKILNLKIYSKFNWKW